MINRRQFRQITFFRLVAEATALCNHCFTDGQVAGNTYFWDIDFFGKTRLVIQLDSS